MIQRKRWRLSPAEKVDIWRRWKCGQSQHEIGRACGRPHPTIRKILLPCGGIAPAARRRSRLSLTLEEREDISRGIASDSSIREIARLLKRSAATVSREVTRHGGRPTYRAHDADRRAWVSALRPKRCLLAGNRRLREVVASKLILDWSPEQISGWLKTRYPNNESMHVSHETIYRSLFIQARGVLRKELMEHLRSKRRMRRSRHASEHGHCRGQIVDAISIRERPAEAEDRAFPGHWEGDLLAGGKNSDPQSPWQRGTNENTNLLLRQYFPRGTDLAPITQAQLDQVELRLNQRPRKTLGFQTPASKLQASVASTV